MNSLRSLLRLVVCSGLFATLSIAANAQVGYAIMRGFGKVLDVPSASSSDGVQIQQWASNGGSHQQWRLTSVGSGQYKIESVSSGKVLQVRSASGSDGAVIEQATYSAASHQKWTIEEIGYPYITYKIVNVSSGKALHMPGTSNGTGLTQQSYSGTDQQWLLIPFDANFGVAVKVTTAGIGRSMYSTGFLPSADLPTQELITDDEVETFRVNPGIGMTVELSPFAGEGYYTFEAPPGFRVQINGYDTNSRDTSSDGSFELKIVPVSTSAGSTPAGTAGDLMIRDGVVIWDISLGSLANGASAGRISMGVSAAECSHFFCRRRNRCK